MATEILATVASSSNAEIQYNICRGGDKVVYCTCPHWKNQRLPAAHRTCKHLKSFHAGQLARKAAVETKQEAGQNLALAKKRTEAFRRAHEAHKAMTKGTAEAAHAAALKTIHDPMVSQNLRAMALAVLARS